VGYTHAGDKPQPFDGYNFRILTKQGAMTPGGAKHYIANGKPFAVRRVCGFRAFGPQHGNWPENPAFAGQSLTGAGEPLVRIIGIYFRH
jgi:hypothetical protein